VAHKCHSAQPSVVYPFFVVAFFGFGWLRLDEVGGAVRVAHK
jgi:hypothetical protein